MYLSLENNNNDLHAVTEPSSPPKHPLETYMYLSCLQHRRLFGLLMRLRLSLGDAENMLAKQTGWCCMMSPRELVQRFAGLIYISPAPRQRALFIKTTLTALHSVRRPYTLVLGPHSPALPSPPPETPKRRRVNTNPRWIPLHKQTRASESEAVGGAGEDLFKIKHHVISYRAPWAAFSAGAS